MIKKMIALDWLGMKVYQKWSLFVLFSIPFMCFFSAHMLLPLTGFCALYLSTSPFFLEEKDDLNYLYLTLRIKRREIVSARYALSCIMFICGAFISSVFIPVIQPFSLMSILVKDGSLNIGFNNYFTILSASYLLFAIFNLSTFPFLFKLGYAKGKIWGYYLPALFFVIFMAIIAVLIVASAVGRNFLLNVVTFASDNPLLTNIAIFVLATGILAISYLISVKVYSKRDF